MRNLTLGLLVVGLIGAVGCGDNNATNNGTNNTTSPNNTTASNNTTGTTGPNNTTGTTGPNNTTGTTGPNNTTGTNNTTGGPSDKCVQYCDLMDANCATNFADRAACETACALYAEDATLDCTAPGDCSGAAGGVECRIYHGDVAGGMPDPHCTHASVDGAGTCD